MRCNKCGGLLEYIDKKGTFEAKNSYFRCYNCGLLKYINSLPDYYPLPVNRAPTPAFNDTCYYCKKPVADRPWYRNFHIFCGKECCKAYIYRKNTHICIICGSIFVTPSTDKRICSPDCKQKRKINHGRSRNNINK